MPSGMRERRSAPSGPWSWARVGLVVVECAEAGIAGIFHAGGGVGQGEEERLVDQPGDEKARRGGNSRTRGDGGCSMLAKASRAATTARSGHQRAIDQNGHQAQAKGRELNGGGLGSERGGTAPVLLGSAFPVQCRSIGRRLARPRLIGGGLKGDVAGIDFKDAEDHDRRRERSPPAGRGAAWRGVGGSWGNSMRLAWKG